MTTENKDFYLSDDMSLDDIEDMPTFECWPTGAYKVMLSEGIKEEDINEHPSYKIPLTLLAEPDLEDDTIDQAERPKVGDELELLFMRDNKFGAASFKKLAVPIAKSLGVGKVGEVVEGSKGVELTILLLKQQAKKKKGAPAGEPPKFYPKIVEVIVN